jgi:hypothetical protein
VLDRVVLPSIFWNWKDRIRPNSRLVLEAHLIFCYRFLRGSLGNFFF